MITTFPTTKQSQTLALVALGAVLALALDATSTSAAAQDRASEIDASRHLSLSRTQLSDLYPGLPSRELDMLVFRIADIVSTKQTHRKRPAGDWFCTDEVSGLFRLTMRETSYSFVGRSSPSMAGEYKWVSGNVEITNGPLKGMGLSRGILASEQNGRTLHFRSDEQSGLTCLEVL